MRYNSFWFAEDPVDGHIIDFCCYSSIKPNYDAIEALKARHPRASFRFSLGCELRDKEVTFLTTFPER